MVNKVRELRKTIELSQNELAEAVGVSRQRISDIECNKANPRLSLCIAICKKLSVTLNDLFR